MNMKKVWDAVSEFEGYISNIPVNGIQGEALIVLCIRDVDGAKSGLMYGGSVGFNEDFYCQVCTYKEFDELVAEMETNFGKSTPEDYFTWIATKDDTSKATKLEVESKVDYKSEEFWKDAPEGATHYGEEDSEFNHGFYKVIDNSAPLYHDGSDWLECEETQSLIPRPQPKPVYTQAMYDKGELPSVGMFIMVDDCNGCGMYIDVEVMYCSDSICVINDGNNDHSFCPHSFRISPIDNRTEKEKAIDDMHDKLGVSIDSLEFIYDAWSKGNE